MTGYVMGAPPLVHPLLNKLPLESHSFNSKSVRIILSFSLWEPTSVNVASVGTDLLKYNLFRLVMMIT